MQQRLLAAIHGLQVGSSGGLRVGLLADEYASHGPETDERYPYRPQPTGGRRHRECPPSNTLTAPSTSGIDTTDAPKIDGPRYHCRATVSRYGSSHEASRSVSDHRGAGRGHR